MSGRVLRAWNGQRICSFSAPKAGWSHLSRTRAIRRQWSDRPCPLGSGNRPHRPAGVSSLLRSVRRVVFRVRGKYPKGPLPLPQARVTGPKGAVRECEQSEGAFDGPSKNENFPHAAGQETDAQKTCRGSGRHLPKLRDDKKTSLCLSFLRDL